MERFFGDGAQTYREGHLSRSAAVLPYGVAVEPLPAPRVRTPNATAAERHAMWQSMEKRYLPWRTYGDLERPSRGAFWQSQLHIYRAPFYYIDYTAPRCACALQMWASSYDDPAGTLERLRRALRPRRRSRIPQPGHERRPRQPLRTGALSRVVARAKEVLAV